MSTETIDRKALVDTLRGQIDFHIAQSRVMAHRTVRAQDEGRSADAEGWRVRQREEMDKVAGSLDRLCELALETGGPHGDV